MKTAGQQNHKRPGFKASVSFLSLVNLFTTGFGVVVGLSNALVLGPEKLGITAIIAALSLSSSTFLDFRIGDVVASSFYTNKESPEQKQRQAMLLCEGVFIAVIQAILIAALAIFLGTTLTSFFTDQKILTWWVLAYAVGIAVTSLGSTLTYLLRFSGQFITIGYTRLLHSLITGTSFLLLVVYHRTLSSYFLAYAAGAVLSTGIIAFIFYRIWKEDLATLSFGEIFQLKNMKPMKGMLVSGNLLSYTELLHKTGDSLVVAYFCSDTITGMYKVIRSMTNMLHLFYDTIGQVSTPVLLQNLEKKNFIAVWTFAKKATAGATLFVVILLVVEYFSFPLIFEFVLGDAYRGIEGPTMIMTLPLIVILGVQLWCWPVFLWKKALRCLAQYSAIAAVLQTVAAITFYHLYPDSLWPGTLAFVANYVFLAPLYLRYSWVHAKKPIPGKQSSLLL